MKYLIYYFFYITSSGIDKNISTIVLIEDNCVKFYIYDLGYVDWVIEHKDELLSDDKNCITGIYHLSLPEDRKIKAIMKTNCVSTVIVIITEEETEQITLKKFR